MGGTVAFAMRPDNMSIQIGGLSRRQMADRVSYRDIKAAVIRRIRTGRWPPGSQIPGEVELAVDFGCARATVNRALRELAEDGLLDRRRKAGTRVAAARRRTARFEIPRVQAEVEAAGKAYGYCLLHREVAAPPTQLMADPGLSGRCLHVVSLHTADGAPFQYEDRWVDLQVVPAIEGADLESTSANAWLVAHVPFSDAEMTFGAATADADAARYLELPAGTPVFEAVRITRLDGRPVTHARMVHGPDYRLHTRY